MRRIYRLAGFLVVCFAFFLLAIVVLGVIGAFGERRRRAFILWGIRAWAGTLLKVMGVSVTATGLRPEYLEKPGLLVSNHLSYLDIIVIDSVFPSAFVAKTEVGGWPVLGPLAKLGKSVFIVREDSLSNVIGFYEACGRFREGYSVAVFPEGTTGDGAALMPFNPLFLALATRARVPVLPVTINIKNINGRGFDSQNRDLVCWYGDIEFGPHFWNFLTIDHLEVSIMFHEPIKAPRGTRTRELSESVRSIIEEGYDGLTGDHHPDQAKIKEPQEEVYSADLIAGTLILFASWFQR